MLKDLKEAFNTITAFIHERNQVLTCLKHRLIYERIEYHDIVPMTDDSGTITFVFDEDVQLLYDIDGTFDIRNRNGRTVYCYSLDEVLSSMTTLYPQFIRNWIAY